MTNIFSRPYTSYFQAQIDNPPVDPPQPLANQSSLFSAYFNVSTTTSAQLNNPSHDESISTVMDNALRALYINKVCLLACLLACLLEKNCLHSTQSRLTLPPSPPPPSQGLRRWSLALMSMVFATTHISLASPNPMI